LTIDEGAIKAWGKEISQKSSWSGLRTQILRQLGVPFDVPWRRIPKRLRDQVLYGTGDRQYRVRWIGKKGGKATFVMEWEGVLPRLMRRFRETTSESAKRWYAQFLADTACPTCGGSRLRPESAAVRLGTGPDARTLVQLSALTIDQVRAFFAALRLPGAAGEIAAELLKEIRSRLDFLAAVGLGYLSLDRAGPSLSGGEAQRIRLASQVGSELTGVIYILDEPSIGLHQRDNRRLLATLEHLRDIGNTVVVVEHDEETIRAADHVIDFGPGAGVRGGEIVHAGTP